jgi:hypothetical protein
VARLPEEALRERWDEPDSLDRARYLAVARLGRSDELDSLDRARYLAVVEPVEIGE